MNDIEKVDNFCKKYFIHLCLTSLFIIILTFIIVCYKGIIYSDIFYLMLLSLGLFFLFQKIIEKEKNNFSKVSIYFIGIIFFNYIIVFSLVGFPKLPLKEPFNNLLIYVIITYILFLFFKIKNKNKMKILFFNIFKILLITCLIIPFINFIFL